MKCAKFEVSTSITFEVMKIKQGNEMTFKMTLNDGRTVGRSDGRTDGRSERKTEA